MYLYIPEFVFKFVLETVEFLPTEWRLLLRVSNKFSDDDDDDFHDDDDDHDEQRHVSMLEPQISSEMIEMVSTVVFRLKHFSNGNNSFHGSNYLFY